MRQTTSPKVSGRLASACELNKHHGPSAQHFLDRGWGILALILSIIGFGASATLVMERLAIYADAGHRTSCDINAWLSCGTVMRTPQAELFGFPIRSSASWPTRL